MSTSPLSVRLSRGKASSNASCTERPTRSVPSCTRSVRRVTQARSATRLGSFDAIERVNNSNGTVRPVPIHTRWQPTADDRPGTLSGEANVPASVQRRGLGSIGPSPLPATAFAPQLAEESTRAHQVAAEDPSSDIEQLADERIAQGVADRQPLLLCCHDPLVPQHRKLL